MKKITLSIFVVSFLTLIGVVVFFVANPKDIDTNVSGEQIPPTQTQEIKVFVDDEVTLFVGQKQQLYLTYSPSNAQIEFLFDENNSDNAVVSIDNLFKLTGRGAGHTVLTIKATYNQQSKVKIVNIVVKEKIVEVLFFNEMFFAGENENYIMTIKSNFQIQDSKISHCDNVNVKGTEKKEIEPFYYEDITFNLKEEGSFMFQVFEDCYNKEAINRPFFEKGFFEPSAYNLENNLITLYLNITNVGLAAENGHNFKTTFIQDISNFEIVVKNTNIARLEDNKIIAVALGNTIVEVFSNIDKDFYLSFNILIKEVSLYDYDLFISGNKISSGDKLNVQVGEEIVLNTGNFLPSYANFNIEKEITFSNTNLKLQQNVITALSEGETTLQININGVLKNIYFEVESAEEETNRQVYLKILNPKDFENPAFILEKEEHLLYIGLEAEVFSLSFIENQNNVEFEEIELHKSREMAQGEVCNIIGSNLQIKLLNDIKLELICFEYHFFINFVIV